MEKRTLGKTSLQLTPIGLGCWQFSQGKGVVGKVWETLEQPIMSEIVQTALDGGINWFDTAEVYGKGNSEKALAAALQRLGKKNGDVHIATKWWPLWRTAASIQKTFPQRQACLAPYAIDLLQIHQPFSLSGIEKQAMALAAMLKSQQVGAVGVSNFNLRQMRAVHKVLSGEGLVLASNQVRYNLLKRDIERNGLLDGAKELGISIIAYSPLAQGLLTGRFHDDPNLVAGVSFMRKQISGIDPKGLRHSEALIRYLQDCAKKHSAAGKPVSAAQVALNWLVNFHGAAVFAIPGASKKRQSEEAAHALDFSLSPSELAAIDGLSKGL